MLFFANAFSVLSLGPVASLGLVACGSGILSRFYALRMLVGCSLEAEGDNSDEKIQQGLLPNSVFSS